MLQEGVSGVAVMVFAREENQVAAEHIFAHPRDISRLLLVCVFLYQAFILPLVTSNHRPPSHLLTEREPMNALRYAFR